MIRVEVEGYCQSCLDFSPDVIEPVKVYAGGDEEITLSDTIIRCEHRRRCAGIKRYLELQMRGEASG